MSHQMHLFETLLEGTEDCPSLVAVLPKVRKAGLFAAARRFGHNLATLGSTHFKCLFLCECCLRNFSGPNKHGYTMLRASALFKAGAPVFALGLKIILAFAAVAAQSAVGGIVPLPGGCSVEEATETHESVLELLDFGTAQAVDEFVAVVVPGHGVAGSAADSALRERMQSATGDAYAHVKKFLDTEDPQAPTRKHLGLERLRGGSGGSLARKWVCSECKPGFVKDGTAFKPTSK